MLSWLPQYRARRNLRAHHGARTESRPRSRVELTGEALRSRQAVAVFDQALDEFPVGVLVETDPHPALRADVAWREEVIRIAADERRLRAGRRFARYKHAALVVG